MYSNSIPVFTRFQWLNHPQVAHILSRFLKPLKRGRKGYDKVLMVRWLLYRQFMNCSYRDLESISGIDHSTFVKFRKRLLQTHWFAHIFKALTSRIAAGSTSLRLILDSSFVETYSGHDETGSEYSGYKEKNGFKLHQIIDLKTRLPILQAATAGARADIVWGAHLIRGAPRAWSVRALLADKAYDGWEFVAGVKQKWKGVRIGIPVRRTVHERTTPFPPEVIRNRRSKEAGRYLKKTFLNQRGEVERYFSRKKRVFRLGEERMRGLENFRANCYLTSIMEILEWATKPSYWVALFT